VDTCACAGLSVEAGASSCTELLAEGGYYPVGFRACSRAAAAECAPLGTFFGMPTAAAAPHSFSWERSLGFPPPVQGGDGERAARRVHAVLQGPQESLRAALPANRQDVHARQGAGRAHQGARRVPRHLPDAHACGQRSRARYPQPRLRVVRPSCTCCESAQGDTERERPLSFRGVRVALGTRTTIVLEG
jgi:hypothetical protein